ncbi:hypothetical protein GCM10027066_22600 [Dyella jejuensis]
MNNESGLPLPLRRGIEKLSGMDMEGVVVHRNSAKPAQLNALAYAHGNDIHLGPGQDRHLPHEAWHVVQQKQGRVQPTMHADGLRINDSRSLEAEADAMGHRAVQMQVANSFQPSSAPVQSQSVVQLVRREHKGIGGLTHLVEMTGDGHIYHDTNWAENEREEVSAGDLLLVDMDDAWLSRRGMHQEANWERDRAGEQKHLWVKAIALNHKKLGANRYVREEMLIDGHEEIPKTMHSIWVQGNYADNPEAGKGLATRQGDNMPGWVNMIWLYRNESESGGFDPGLKSKPLDVRTEGFERLLERGFVEEMERWQRRGDRPGWVAHWLPILDVLYRKKSYIAMSDIMRMIILYYEGGLYMDMKIQVDAGRASFKERPMLLINTANFYDRENWAIMANAGCRMIEAIMLAASQKFPSVEELQTYPENYQGAAGQEGSTHVALHEDKGVWNAVEKYREHCYELGIKLTNPRAINSWFDAYDDRAGTTEPQEKDLLASFRRELELMGKADEDRAIEQPQSHSDDDDDELDALLSQMPSVPVSRPGASSSKRDDANLDM